MFGFPCISNDTDNATNKELMVKRIAATVYATVRKSRLYFIHNKKRNVRRAERTTESKRLSKIKAKTMIVLYCFRISICRTVATDNAITKYCIRETKKYVMSAYLLK